MTGNSTKEEDKSRNHNKSDIREGIGGELNHATHKTKMIQEQKSNRNACKRWDELRRTKKTK